VTGPGYDQPDTLASLAERVTALERRASWIQQQAEEHRHDHRCSDCPIPGSCTSDCYLARGDAGLYGARPGQRYRLSEEAASAVARAALNLPGPQPYLTLSPDGITLDLWVSPLTDDPSI
jgi:hypothetical protein